MAVECITGKQHTPSRTKGKARWGGKGENEEWGLRLQWSKASGMWLTNWVKTNCSEWRLWTARDSPGPPFMWCSVCRPDVRMEAHRDHQGLKHDKVPRDADEADLITGHRTILNVEAHGLSLNYSPTVLHTCGWSKKNIVMTMRQLEDFWSFCVLSIAILPSTFAC